MLGRKGKLWDVSRRPPEVGVRRAVRRAQGRAAAGRRAPGAGSVVRKHRGDGERCSAGVTASLVRLRKRGTCAAALMILVTV